MAKQLPRTIRTLGPNRESQPTVPAERRRGRPPIEVTEEQVGRAALMARYGATDEEIAVELGCSVGTLYVWYRQWPELSEAIKAGKEQLDDRVERSLYLRATAGGSDTAAIFWLKNRRRNQWRDRHETEIVVPEQESDSDRPSTRQLALASLALLSQAAYDPEPQTIDVTPNTVEEAEDDAQDAYRDAEEASQVDDFDPDFDL